MNEYLFSVLFSVESIKLRCGARPSVCRECRRVLLLPDGDDRTSYGDTERKGYHLDYLAEDSPIWMQLGRLVQVFWPADQIPMSTQAVSTWTVPFSFSVVLLRGCVRTSFYW